MSRMRERTVLWEMAAGCVLALLFGPSVIAGGEPPEIVQRYDVELYDPGALLESAQSAQPFALPLPEGDLWIQLEENLVRSERFRAWAVNRDGRRPLLPDPARLFKGKVLGDPDSIVRLSFTSRGATAFIQTAQGVTFIEPLRGKSALRRKPEGSVEHRVFSDADLGDLPIGTCGTLEGARELWNLEHLKEPVASLAAQKLLPAEGEYLRMEIAVEADASYHLEHGAETAAYIEGVLNTVEGIYQSDLRITFDLTSIEIHEEGDEPYSSISALELLGEFRSRWNSEKDGVPRDVAHLFTGKDLEGSTVGIAYVGEVCYLPNAYSLTQDIQSPSLVPLLVAHEVGHNLGAYHDDPESTPQYIMQPVLSGSTLAEFSQESVADIDAYLARSDVNCLDLVTSLEDPAGEATDETTPDPGGGGGGPVDPFLLVACAVAAVARKRRRRGISS
ncbi:MAG: hypothetical protein JXA90_08920 [Planctomycetes bacterium]|nr:hypothetical protein [Planctomycetota bacterium]